MYKRQTRCFAKSYSSSCFCCRDKFDRAVIPSSWLACSFLPDGWTELFFLPGGWKEFSLQFTCFLSRLYFLDGLVHDGVVMSSGEPFVKLAFNDEAIYGVPVFMKILYVGWTSFQFLMVGKCLRQSKCF